MLVMNGGALLCRYYLRIDEDQTAEDAEDGNLPELLFIHGGQTSISESLTLHEIHVKIRSILVLFLRLSPKKFLGFRFAEIIFRLIQESFTRNQLVYLCFVVKPMLGGI